MFVALSLLEVHTSWSWIMIVGNAMAGVWALLNAEYLSTDSIASTLIRSI
jgi:hypothetical protein